TCCPDCPSCTSSAWRAMRRGFDSMSVRMFNSVVDNRMKLPSFLTSALSTAGITRAPESLLSGDPGRLTEGTKQSGLWTLDAEPFYRNLRKCSSLRGIDPEVPGPPISVQPPGQPNPAIGSECRRP